MGDTAKILLGAIVGFVVGLLAEPIKFWISRELKARQARKALYRDIAVIHNKILTMFAGDGSISRVHRLEGVSIHDFNLEPLSDLDNSTATELEMDGPSDTPNEFAEEEVAVTDITMAHYQYEICNINFDVFDHYHTGERAAYYTLREAETFKNYYQTIRRASETIGEDFDAGMIMIKSAITLMRVGIRMGDVDQFKLAYGISQVRIENGQRLSRYKADDTPIDRFDSNSVR